MQKVYIVKGVETSQDNKPMAVISEHGVKETEEKALKELRTVFNEIIKIAKENELEVTDWKSEPTKFYIELNGSDTYEYEIVEIEITE